MPNVLYKSLSFFGFPDYCIGTDCSVWTRRIKGGQYQYGVNKTGPWKLMKPTIAKAGYPTYEFTFNGKRKRTTVHRLMMLAFVGPCPKGMECCHNDGDPLNNDLSNLRYDTHQNNGKDMIKHGTHFLPMYKGEHVGTSKLTEQDVLRIRRYYSTGKYTKKKLAAAFFVSESNIKQIIARTSWKHI